MAHTKFLICKATQPDNSIKNLKFKVQSLIASKTLLNTIISRNKSLAGVKLRFEYDDGRVYEYKLNGVQFRNTGILAPCLSEFKR